MRSDLMNQKEAAKYLGLTTRTLLYWRQIGTGPKAYKIGSRWLFKKADLDKFIDEDCAVEFQKTA